MNYSTTPLKKWREWTILPCSADFVPFDVVKDILRDFVYIQYLISGEGEVEATLQTDFPQLLGGLVCIQAGVAQQEADYNEQQDSR